MATKKTVARSRAAKPVPRVELELGGTIDALFDLRARRLEIERSAEELKREEAELRGTLFELLGKARLQSASGARATFSVRSKLAVRIVDPPTFWKYLMRTGELDLLEQRPSTAAFKERLDAGTRVPGVAYEDVPSYSLTKRGSAV